MQKILIIADDFTGALDTGVKCANAGLRTTVIIDGEHFENKDAGDVDVLIMNLPTRHCTREVAYQTVYNAVHALKDTARIVMKKTDSAMRGNIGGELAALLNASGEEVLAFLPAFPQIGRTTKDGLQYVNGQPIHESAFGRDPFEPVSQSDICGILREQTLIPARSFPATASIPDNFCGIAVFDSESDAQMCDMVARLQKCGRLRLVAGCAGLGAAIAGMLSDNGQTVCTAATFRKFTVICGSVSPVSAKQIAFAEKHGFYTLLMGGRSQCDASFCESKEYREQLSTLCERSAAGQPIIVASRGMDDDTQCTNQATQGACAAGARFADMLAVIAQDLMDRREEDTLLVVGGDTLLALMRRLHISRIEPQRELTPGVVLSYIQYGGRKREIISKAGSFGDEDIILRLWEQARE